MIELIALSPWMRWTVLLLLFALVSGLAFVGLRAVASRRLILERLDAQSREAMVSESAAARLSMASSRASAWSRLTERIERGGLSLGDSDPKALQRKMIAAGYRSPAAPKIFTLVRIIMIIVLPLAIMLPKLLSDEPISAGRRFCRVGAFYSQSFYHRQS
jgi:tight adherence protein C